MSADFSPYSGCRLIIINTEKFVALQGAKWRALAIITNRERMNQTIFFNSDWTLDWAAESSFQFTQFLLNS